MSPIAAFSEQFTDLFINFMKGYISIILYKITFEPIHLTPQYNASFKNNCYVILSSKTWREPKN